MAVGRMLALCPEAVKLWWNLLFGILGEADGGWAQQVERGCLGSMGLLEGLGAVRDRAPARTRNESTRLLRGEAVANTGLGQDVSRASGIGFELSPELGHVDPQVVGLLGVGWSPDFIEQLAVCQ